MPSFPPRQTFCRGKKLGLQIQNGAGAGQKYFANFRQLHAASLPLKQRHAQITLKLADLLAERGLLNTQCLCGMGNAAMFSNGYEVAQVPDIHMVYVIHMDNVFNIYWKTGFHCYNVRAKRT